MGDWISVKERIPPETKDVFIEFRYEWQFTPGKHVCYYDIGRIYNGEWRGGDYFNQAKNPKVRFWMEIPPVPETEEE